MAFLVKCPYCSQHFRSRPEFRGQRVTCSCGGQFQVPAGVHSDPLAQQTYPAPQAYPSPQAYPAPQPYAAAPSAFGAAGQQRRSSNRGERTVLVVLLTIVATFAGMCLVGGLGVVWMLSAVTNLASSGMPQASGTGFVVHNSGYVLTNHHVIDGPGQLLVYLPNHDKTVDASVVAKDPHRDIALLRLHLGEGSQLRPMELSPHTVGRGSQVAAFGYPLGEALGADVKLTTGVVSALPDRSNYNMLLLDCRVNPGNSGGPLCDNRGRVVGMVTAKSIGGFGVDSYGMAIPASDLQRFLQQHIASPAPTPMADTGPREWDEIDREVSSAVLMVIKQ